VCVLWKTHNICSENTDEQSSVTSIKTVGRYYSIRCTMLSVCLPYPFFAIKDSPLALLLVNYRYKFVFFKIYCTVYITLQNHSFPCMLLNNYSLKIWVVWDKKISVSYLWFIFWTSSLLDIVILFCTWDFLGFFLVQIPRSRYIWFFTKFNGIVSIAFYSFHHSWRWMLEYELIRSQPLSSALYPICNS